MFLSMVSAAIIALAAMVCGFIGAFKETKLTLVLLRANGALIWLAIFMICVVGAMVSKI